MKVTFKSAATYVGMNGYVGQCMHGITILICMINFVFHCQNDRWVLKNLLQAEYKISGNIHPLDPPSCSGAIETY